MLLDSPQIKRVLELESLLRNAADAYYAGKPEILSDDEFDRLREELEELDPQNPFLAEVGAITDNSLQKVTHVIPMGSLKKITTIPELQTWSKQFSPDEELAVQLKLDGISIELVYDNGKFIQAITRGDGIVGDDVTHSIKNAQGFPRNISLKQKIFVRCECVLPIKTWEQHFNDMANPRNAVAGISRRLDGTGSEHILTIAFDVLFDDHPFLTEQDRINWLETNNFTTVQNTITSINDIEKIINDILQERDNLPFQIDGAVIKTNRIKLQNKLGEHDGRPYWARAWKFPPQGGHTVLKNVIWSVGTQGTVTPVAQVEPVSVGGTTIQNVTLHNIDEIDRLKIQIGDTIEVIRAGDVIPKIVRVVKQGINRQPIVLHKCPICDSNLIKDGPKLICQNKRCDGIKLSIIKKWISKREIMFLGESAIETLYNTKLVTSIADLYTLNKESMILAGLGERMSEKILEQIRKSKTCTLADFLGSLSLDMLGRSEANNLIEHGFDSLEKWKTITPEQIQGFPGYQKTKAQRIASSVSGSWAEIEILKKILTIETNKNTKVSGKLSGKSFCFTGTMNRPRKDLEQIVEQNGGAIRSVSKELDFLVVADPNSISSKTKKAKSLNVKIISETQFMKIAEL